MISINRSLILICILVNLKFVYNQLEEGGSCYFEGSRGICSKIKSCEPLVKLLSNAPRPIPNSIRQRLLEAQCGFSGYDPLVCCVSDVQPVTNSPTRSPQTRRPNTNVNTNRNDDVNYPDVSGHRNLRLLPTVCGEFDDDRIWGGKKTGLFEFPWMVLLAYNTERGVKYRCGGSLISERYVLTAAHCVTNLSPTLTLHGVVVGDHDIRTNPDCERIDFELICAPEAKNVSIEKVIAHPGYTTKTLHNDIALIRLSESVSLSADNVKAVCLPTTNQLQTYDLIKKNATVSGWGATETGLDSPSLLKVDLPVVANDQCQNVYKLSAQIDNTQICAGGERNRDSCGGDSGGPLMYPGLVDGALRYVQYGIVSFGHRGCGRGNFPGVYTFTAKYIDWILDNIRD